MTRHANRGCSLPTSIVAEGDRPNGQKQRDDTGCQD
jgi:hypothetical protein